MRHALRVLLVLGVSSGVLSADVKLPQPSPASTISQEIGITKITLEYHRPSVKGRVVWGGLVPYGEIWRIGANEATTLAFTTAVKLAGRDVPAGAYALFAIPGKESWTLVLDKRPKQWGAYFRNAADELLRFDVKPEAGPLSEWMTFAIVPAGPSSVRVEWSWEKLRFSFPIEVEVTPLVWKEIDAALAAAKPDDWQVYLQATQYARQEKARLAEAKVWIDKSISIKESFYNLEAKARILADEGKTAEAIPLVEKAMALAKGKAPQAYLDLLEKTLSEWRGQPKS